jgi:hypothetical protein
VNLPDRGPRGRSNVGLLIHELVHVYQYERAGSRYLIEALAAQRGEGYDYAGPDGLKAARSAGRCLADFNREQQAQILQDYYARLASSDEVDHFEGYADDLRSGKI